MFEPAKIALLLTYSLRRLAAHPTELRGDNHERPPQNPATLLIGLMASLPLALAVFGATGTVKFIDSTDLSKELTWARQGGQVGLQVTDADLNIAVKRVLLPIDMTENAASSTIVKGSSIVTLNTSVTVSLPRRRQQL